MADVTVIGGGVIGLSVADELVRAGATVRLLDRAEFGLEASWAGAGMLPPGTDTHARTPEARLRGLSNTLWPELSARLREETGVDNGFRRCGAVLLHESEAQTRAASEAWHAEDVPAEPLALPEVHRLEPHLHAARLSSLHLPTQAQVRNPRHLKALLAACVARGVELVPGAPATGWTRDGDRLREVRTPLGRFASDAFVLAAGAWTGGLLDGLGLGSPIRPVRGQMLLLRTRGTVLSRIIELGPRYLVPRGDGRLLVGSTEEQVGFDKRLTAAGVAGLTALALKLCPPLADATLERAWAGLRPGSPDGLPAISRVPGVENLVVAAGHFRAGLQLSPATALLVRQLLTGQPTTIPVGPYDIDRWATDAPAAAAPAGR